MTGVHLTTRTGGSVHASRVSGARGWAVTLGLVALLLVLGAGCRVRTELAVDVAENGSGTVTVSVALDEDAVAAYPSLAEDIRVEDLTATGWSVTGPAEEDDGLTWIRVTKPFATPEDATAVLAEVAGAEGPFRDFRVTGERTFARTTYAFEGTVDFDAGLEDFADDALAEALDGQPLGRPVEELERIIGETVDEVFRVRVVVRLPGAVEANAPTRLVNGAAWEPRLSLDEPVVLRARGEIVRVGTLAAAGSGAVAGLAAVVIVVTAIVRRRIRPRGRHGQVTAS